MRAHLRPYTPNDAPALLRILTAPGGHIITRPPEEIAASFAANRVLVYEDNGIQGFANLEVSPNISQIILFTAPDRRGQGTGEKLWRASLEILREVDPATIWVFYRQDVGAARDFYTARGCQVWYAYHHMAYTGPAFPEPALESRLYQDADFEEYYAARSAAFANLLDTLGSQEDEEVKKERTRRWASDNAAGLYLFHQHGALIGSLAIIENYLIDELFVIPGLQGCGYGRALVHFAVNRILERGHRPELAVVTTNTTAARLYERCGFELLQTLELARILNPNKTADLRAPGA